MRRLSGMPSAQWREPHMIVNQSGAGAQCAVAAASPQKVRLGYAVEPTGLTYRAVHRRCMRGIVRCSFGLAALLLAAPAWGAATLTGVVSLNREHGTPVSGVAISALGANPVISGNDGAFVLSFPQGRAGQDVKVVVN